MEDEEEMIDSIVASVKYLWRHFPGMQTPASIYDTIDVIYENHPKPKVAHEIRTKVSWLIIFTLQPGNSYEGFMKLLPYFQAATRKPVTIEQKNGYAYLEIFDKDIKARYPYEWNPEPYEMLLPVPIGYSLRGLEVTDLASLPHMLDAGTTFTGKSCFLHNIVASLGILPNVQLAVIDLSLLEFSYVSDYAAFAYDVSTALQLLRYIEKEMHRRRKVLYKAGVVKIQDYKGNMPYIVIIIDEFGLFNSKGITDKQEKVMRQDCHAIVANIAQLARKVGIHLVVACQRPDRDVLPGLIKGNIDGKLSFRTINRTNSEIILDDGAAAKLPNIQGRVVWQVGNSQIECQVMHCPPEQAKKILKEKGVIRGDWFKPKRNRLEAR
jgi:hypothetical protein